MRLLILMCFIFSPMAFAVPVCDYHFDLNNATFMADDAAQVIRQDIDVYRGQNSPVGRCGIYRLFFSKGLANSYQRTAIAPDGSTYKYNLHPAINQNGILKEFNDALNANERLEGLAPNKDTTYITPFYISTQGILGQDFPASGNYTDIVQISLYGFNDNSGNYNFEETSPFTITFVVPKRILVSLIDEGSVFDASSTSKVMDFGNITQNAVKGADLRVLSNTPYQVRVSSTNNGKLKHTVGDTIDYSLKVNDASVSLASSANSPVSIGTGGMTTAAGARYNLKVQITGSTDDKRAGLYQDVITITAIAN